jgi:hypothetical protein
MGLTGTRYEERLWIQSVLNKINYWVYCEYGDELSGSRAPVGFTGRALIHADKKPL